MTAAPNFRKVLTPLARYAFAVDFDAVGNIEAIAVGSGRKFCRSHGEKPILLMSGEPTAILYNSGDGTWAFILGRTESQQTGTQARVIARFGKLLKALEASGFIEPAPDGFQPYTAGADGGHVAVLSA